MAVDTSWTLLFLSVEDVGEALKSAVISPACHEDVRRCRLANANTAVGGNEWAPARLPSSGGGLAISPLTAAIVWPLVAADAFLRCRRLTAVSNSDFLLSTTAGALSDDVAEVNDFAGTGGVFGLDVDSTSTSCPFGLVAVKVERFVIVVEEVVDVPTFNRGLDNVRDGEG